MPIDVSKDRKFITVLSRDYKEIGKAVNIYKDSFVIHLFLPKYKEFVHDKIVIPIEDVLKIDINKIVLKKNLFELDFDGICPKCHFRIVNGRCKCT